MLPTPLSSPEENAVSPTPDTPSRETPLGHEVTTRTRPESTPSELVAEVVDGMNEGRVHLGQIFEAQTEIREGVVTTEVFLSGESLAVRRRVLSPTILHQGAKAQRTYMRGFHRVAVAGILARLTREEMKTRDSTG